MKKTLTNPLYHKLLAAALLVGGTFQLAAPIIAAGTSAGTGISNTATATYNDPNNPTEVIDATSNTVTITVAEVAGITNVASGVTDSTPGTSVLPGDTLTYDYVITNVGNDTTTIFIPAPVVTGPATQTGAITYDIDVNGDGTYEFTAANLTTATTTALNPGGFIRVHVPVVVAPTATSGAPIVVRLGDTGANDNSAGTQNQPDAADTALATEVRTVDITTELAPNAGIPTNGESEASATQQILVGAQPQAFATVLKTQGAYSDGGTVGVFNDDLQTYNLSLRVENAAPVGASAALVPADLEGTPVNVNGTSANRILVSDAIPTGTTLSTATPVAPSGPGVWTVVYTTSLPTVNANAALWVTARPASGITRVGYVLNAPTTVVKGTTVTGFSFQVMTSGLNAASGGTVANIAQVFGETVGGGTTIVYDESGDQSPTNFNDNGTRGPNTGIDANGDGIPEPIIGTGVANPTTDENDPTGTNTGTGAGGEDNILILAPTGTVLNGPSGAPAAVGPSTNNDDFTNQSTDIPAGTVPGTTINPLPEVFTNTLSAPTTALTNVLLRPDDGAATGTLPTGTTVTLTFGASSAVYTYDGSSFIFTSGTAIQVPSISAGTSVNYTTTIDLPAGTALSTDLPAAYLNGYQAPILAFTDLNANGTLDLGESSNTTIDRVYTGFLRLVKESRILPGTGPAVTPGQEVFSTASKSPAPGNIIEYRISYSNISTAVSGSSNITLSASNVTITESGVTNLATFPAPPNGNNWGQDYSLPAGIDTSNVIGSAVDSGTGATITFFSGTLGTVSATDQTGSTPATDVTRYVNTVSVPIEPGVAARTFTFRRTVN